MAKQKTSGNGKIATEIRSCPVKLTEAERIARGNEMSACELNIESLKGHRASTGRTIREHEKRRNELGHMLEVGTESRELKCTWVPDYAHNVFRLTRPDTKEVVDTRAMTADDRQQDLVAVAPEDDVVMVPPPRSPRPRKSKRPADAASPSNDVA
jgi:hypothetical protein